MGAVRVALCGGGEDVFADERVGDDVGSPSLTVFDFRYEVSAARALTVTITQLFRDRRYSRHLHPVSSVEVAHYQPMEWLTVIKE